MAETAPPTLWHIPISHYSEKVRWALDYKGIEHERHAPMAGYHMAVAMWLTRGRHYTFPVLRLNGRAIGDSSAIVAALEEHRPAPPLYPADPEQRSRALHLEEWFDEQLGPHIRRFAFHAFGEDRPRMRKLAAQQAPGALAHFGAGAAAYARTYTSLRFGAGSDRQAERSREKVLAALDRLEAELDSSEHLVGERFSVADLTAAALFYPLVMPSEGPSHHELPETLARFREPLAERRGFRWVQDMFRLHRKRDQRTAQGANRGSVAAPDADAQGSVA
jgi:glutathione S-transferase